MSPPVVTAFGMPGPGEMFIILLVMLLLFGASKLPALARALGKSLGEFKKGREEGMNPDENKDSSEAEDKTDSTQ